MRLYLFYIIALSLFFSTSTLHTQTQSDLSQNLASGLAEFRKDIFERKQSYIQRFNELITEIDSSSIAVKKKDAILDFIQRDVQLGAQSNSLEIYDQIPKDSPYKSIYIERYIANNQDYQIDENLILEMTLTNVLTDQGKINSSKSKEIVQDFEFLEIEKNDRIFVYKAYGALYAMYLGYTFEGIDIVVHNYNLFGHYVALDRADRYPNINNGNSIEFLHDGNDMRLTIKGDQWDKIIIRDPTFFEQSPGYILKSLHDNITKDGYLYIYLNVPSDQENCTEGLSEEKIIKIAQRSEFKLIDKLKMGCQTNFKFQSIKE